MSVEAKNSELFTYEESWIYLDISRSVFIDLKDKGEFGEVVYLTAKNPRIMKSKLDAFLDRKIAEAGEKK